MSHIHEKIDFTVEVFIVYKNKVLLRMHDKHHIWLSVGGHIEINEDPEQAAKREVLEECGLEINLVDTGTPSVFNDTDYVPMVTPAFMGKHFVNEIHEHVTFVYFATTNTDVLHEALYEHEKYTDFKWVTMQELDTMNLKSNVLFYAKKALEKIGT